MSFRGCSRMQAVFLSTRSLSDFLKRLCHRDWYLPRPAIGLQPQQTSKHCFSLPWEGRPCRGCRTIIPGGWRWLQLPQIKQAEDRSCLTTLLAPHLK
jgi:hypothetical protein